MQGVQCKMKMYNVNLLHPQCIFLHSIAELSVADLEVPSPSIAAFIDDSNEHYCIYIERSILCKSTRFSDALFLMFASYYILPSKRKVSFAFPSRLYFWLCGFLWKAMRIPVEGYADSCGRNATCLATVSDICKAYS